MTYRTVQRLADAATPEDLFQGRWQNRRTKLDDFKPYLHERWAEGCTNAWTLWEEIKTHGYRGGYGAVRAYRRPFRTIPGTPAARPPSPRTVTGWILPHPDTLPEGERLKLKSVLAHCPELEALTAHVRVFGKMLTQLEGDRLPQWMKRSAPTTCPVSTLSPTDSNETLPPSPLACPCPGARALSKATSTGSKCSSGRCTDALVLRS